MTIPLTLYSRYKYNLHVQTINTKHFFLIDYLDTQDTPKTGVQTAHRILQFDRFDRFYEKNHIPKSDTLEARGEQVAIARNLKLVVN